MHLPLEEEVLEDLSAFMLRSVLQIRAKYKPNHKLRVLCWTLHATVANKPIALYGVQRYACVEGLCLEVWLICS